MAAENAATIRRAARKWLVVPPNFVLLTVVAFDVCTRTVNVVPVASLAYARHTVVVHPATYRDATGRLNRMVFVVHIANSATQA